MSEDEFTKLYKFMQAEFKAIHEQLANTATKMEELNNLTNAVDAFAKRSETYMQDACFRPQGGSLRTMDS